MTAIAYPDCWATSPNKKWLLEARSPHNRTILHRDGTAPSDDEFGFKYGEFQSHFRYRLLYNAGKSFQANATEGAQVIWERWQEKREESPHEVVVSDEGWSIIRTHGFQPSLIVISPAGAQTLKVRIMAPDQASKEPVADTSPAADVDNSRAGKLSTSATRRRACIGRAILGVTFSSAEAPHTSFGEHIGISDW